MNKNEVIEVMAQAADMSKNSAARALDAFVDTVTGSLRDGNDVVLVGFGSFTTSKRSVSFPQRADEIRIFGWINIDRFHCLAICDEAHFKSCLIGEGCNDLRGAPDCFGNR